MASRAVLIVPGMWEGPRIFDGVAHRVRGAGIEVYAASLASTGAPAPGPTMYDDVASIRTTLAPLVEAGKEIVLVVHSAGGFLGPEAMEGLDRATREAAGQPGGVVKIIFIAAAVVPKDHVHTPMPFLETKNGMMHAPNLTHLGFNDLPDEQAEIWAKFLMSQPSDGWYGTTKFAGWDLVPSTYVVCKQDAAISVEAQEELAKVAGSTAVEYIDAGHMPHVSKPDELAQLIVKHTHAI